MSNVSLDLLKWKNEIRGQRIITIRRFVVSHKKSLLISCSLKTFGEGASFSLYIVDHRACTTKRGRAILAIFPCTFTRISTLEVARRNTVGKYDEERRRIEWNDDRTWERELQFLVRARRKRRNEGERKMSYHMP